MCWNNSGEYGVTPPDIEQTKPFTGTALEADGKFRKPALGTKMKPLYVNDSDLSVLDSILYPNYEDSQYDTSYTPLLQIPNKR